MPTALRPIRQLAVIVTLVVGMLLPSALLGAESPLAAGLVAAVLALVVLAVAIASSGPAVSLGSRVRGVRDRIRPRPAQSDPDARGHARPRAPGRRLTAV